MALGQTMKLRKLGLSCSMRQPALRTLGHKKGLRFCIKRKHTSQRFVDSLGGWKRLHDFRFQNHHITLLRVPPKVLPAHALA